MCLLMFACRMILQLHQACKQSMSSSRNIGMARDNKHFSTHAKPLDEAPSRSMSPPTSANPLPRTNGASTCCQSSLHLLRHLPESDSICAQACTESTAIGFLRPSPSRHLPLSYGSLRCEGPSSTVASLSPLSNGASC